MSFLSARDADGSFVTVGGLPDWQAVVVYAAFQRPFANGVRKDLRRYEWRGAIPQNWLAANFDPGAGVNVSATDIQFPDGVNIDRTDGLDKVPLLNTFTATVTLGVGYPLNIAVEILVPNDDAGVPITLSTELTGRNRN